MTEHHVRVFKTDDEYPWRVECTCGNWQNGDRWRPVFNWAFDHVRADGKMIT